MAYRIILEDGSGNLLTQKVRARSRRNAVKTVSKLHDGFIVIDISEWVNEDVVCDSKESLYDKLIGDKNDK